MWRTLLSLALLAGSTLFSVCAVAGEIQGRVIILRTLTKKRVSIPDYQLRGAALSSSAASTDDSVASEYKRVVIYLESASQEPPEPITATLAQKGRQFDPEITVVPVGSTVLFPNDDPIFHNVFSLSPTKKFDLGYYPAGNSRSVKFTKPGVVQVFCHLHSDMSAAIVVVPTKWNARPGPDGAFKFPSLPSGEYEVVVWHKTTGFFKKRVTLTKEGSQTLSFTIPLAAE